MTACQLMESPMRMPKSRTSHSTNPYPARRPDDALAAAPTVDAVPAIVSQAYEAASAGLRVRILNRMLRTVGPLALAVVAGGAFARYVTQARWSALSVSISDAARVTSSQVYELATYVQQSNPEVARQILSVLSRDVSTMTALGATVGAILIGYMSGQPRR